LNAEELNANGFPVLTPAPASPADAGSWGDDDTGGEAEWRAPAGFVATKTALADWAALARADAVARPPMSPLRLVALDCEMCQTAEGHQVARVTLVNDRDDVLLDAIVKPVLPIVDFLTQYSGMTAELIAAATHTFAEVQEAVRAILDGDGSGGGGGVPAFVVGHSVDGDLRSLKMVHSRVMDTSVAYLHPAGLPIRHALRHLVRTHLHREIQTGHGVAGAGHCSTEDAIAALHLVKRLLFGDHAADLPSMHAAWGAGATSAGGSASGGGGRSGAMEEEDVGVPLPPPAKRAAVAGGAGGSVGVPSNPLAAHTTARSHPFHQHFASPGSDARMPPLDHSAAAGADGAVPRLSIDRARERDGLGLRGAASAMPALRGEAAGGADAAAVGSKRPRDEDAPPAAGRSVPRAPAAPKAPSLFARTMFSGRDRSVCPGVSLIGNHEFTRRHAAGSCACITAPVNPSASSLSAVLEKALVEAKRMHLSRKPGQLGYLGIVVAQCEFPRAAPAAGKSSSHPAPDWAAVDAALGGFTSRAPAGTLVMLLTEASTGGSVVPEVGGSVALAARKAVADAALAVCEAGERTMLSTDEPASWGNVFLWPPMAAAAAATDGSASGSGSAGGGGEVEGGSDSEDVDGSRAGS